MGRVIVTAKIENANDVENRERGGLEADKVREVEVADALVDTGATSLMMPKRLVAELCLRHYRTRPARGLGGAVEVRMFGPVWLSVQGRECVTDVGEIADDMPVLIGQIPLESMDWVVDSKNRKLIGNPAHGGEHVIEVYAAVPA